MAALVSLSVLRAAPAGPSPVTTSVLHHLPLISVKGNASPAQLVTQHLVGPPAFSFRSHRLRNSPKSCTTSTRKRASTSCSLAAAPPSTTYPVPGSTVTNTRVIFVEDPAGGPVVEDRHIKVVTEPLTIPTSPSQPGTLVLKNEYLSLDPYMRSRFNTSQPGYVFPPFEIGKPIKTFGVGRVVSGSRLGISQGSLVISAGPVLGVETYSVLSPDEGVAPILPPALVPVIAYFGALGLTGLTAHYGLSLCSPKPGQAIYVSGAAGGVGQLVGQVAKIRGMRVIGSAGSDEKVSLLKSFFGFDEAFNYKTVDSIEGELKKFAPEGLDVYFDNVGSECLDAALARMKNHAIIISCGMISQYNGEAYPYKNLLAVVFKRLRMQGFIVSDVSPVELATFLAEMGSWLAQGKIKSKEYLVEGVANAPAAFLGLFKGTNVGKVIIVP